jgi:hypothetical protein
MVQAVVEFVGRVLNLVAAGLPLVEEALAELGEVETRLADPPEDALGLERLLIRVRDVGASGRLLVAVERLCATHPLLQTERHRGEGQWCQVLTVSYFPQVPAAAPDAA